MENDPAGLILLAGVIFVAFLILVDALWREKEDFTDEKDIFYEDMKGKDDKRK